MTLNNFSDSFSPNDSRTAFPRLARSPMPNRDIRPPTTKHACIYCVCHVLLPKYSLRKPATAVPVARDFKRHNCNTFPQRRINRCRTRRERDVNQASALPRKSIRREENTYLDVETPATGKTQALFMTAAVAKTVLVVRINFITPCMVIGTGAYVHVYSGRLCLRCLHTGMQKWIFDQ